MRWALAVTVLTLVQGAVGQGLISVPSAEVLPKGAASLDAEVDTGRRLHSSATLALTTWRFGLTRWLTVGADVRLNRRTVATPNFRVQLGRSAHWAVACGAENVGVRSFGEQPFLTVSRVVGWARWHLGWTRDERNEAMVGFEGQLSRRWAVQSDFITGRGNFWAVGVQWAFAARGTLTVAILVPNAHGDERGFFVDLNWTYAAGR